MSVGSPTLSTTPPRQLEGSIPRPEQTNAEFEARWAAWVARGRQHDLAVQRKFRVVLSIAAVIGLLAALIFGITAGVR